LLPGVHVLRVKIESMIRYCSSLHNQNDSVKLNGSITLERNIY